MFSKLTTIVLAFTMAPMVIGSPHPQIFGRDDLNDLCKTTYVVSGNGLGNSMASLGDGFDSLSCCEACANSKSCVANMIYLPSTCIILVHNTMQLGENVTDICPNGINAYNFGEPNPAGTTYKGPCAV